MVGWVLVILKKLLDVDYIGAVLVEDHDGVAEDLEARDLVTTIKRKQSLEELAALLADRDEGGVLVLKNRITIIQIHLVLGLHIKESVVNQVLLKALDLLREGNL